MSDTLATKWTLSDIEIGNLVQLESLIEKNQLQVTDTQESLSTVKQLINKRDELYLKHKDDCQNIQLLVTQSKSLVEQINQTNEHLTHLEESLSKTESAIKLSLSELVHTSKNYRFDGKINSLPNWLELQKSQLSDLKIKLQKYKALEQELALQNQSRSHLLTQSEQIKQQQNDVQQSLTNQQQILTDTQAKRYALFENKVVSQEKNSAHLELERCQSILNDAQQALQHSNNAITQLSTKLSENQMTYNDMQSRVKRGN